MTFKFDEHNFYFLDLEKCEMENQFENVVVRSYDGISRCFLTNKPYYNIN